MFYAVGLKSSGPSFSEVSGRMIDAVGGALKPFADAVATSERNLAGFRVGFIGDAASRGLLDLVRDMGADVEICGIRARGQSSGRRLDAVVISWPSAAGREAAEWTQVARMRIDNPRLAVILMDWTAGSVFLPEHDLHLARGASRSEIRATFTELRRLRREQAMAAEALSAPACASVVRPLFRRSAKAAAPVTVFPGNKAA